MLELSMGLSSTVAQIISYATENYPDYLPYISDRFIEVPRILEKDNLSIKL